MKTQKNNSSKIRPYDFHGFTIYLNYSCDPDGNISKLIISWREPTPRPRGKKTYGSKVIERRYNLISSSPVHKDSENLDEIISKTLEHVMPQFFLPALFDKRRDLLTGELHLAVALPYAWRKQEEKELVHYLEETTVGRRAAYQKLLNSYGENEIKNLSPRNVAPWLMGEKMSRKNAYDCVILLRILFHIFARSNPSDDFDTLERGWRTYSTKPFRSKYSPKIQARNRLLSPILGEAEIKEFMTRCEKNIQSVDAVKFFVAATMLVTGISLAEACSLKLDDFKKLTGYETRYGLQIEREAKRIGSKKINDTEGSPIYSICDINDLYQRRFLALGEWHTSLLNKILKRKVPSNTLLLQNPRNKKRILHPEAFSDWLDRQFGYIIKKQTVFVDKEIESSYRIADYLASTAPHMLRSYGYAIEEFRYQSGLAPSNTDSKHYTDFKSASALVKMGVIQDLWLANTYNCTCQHSLTPPSKTFMHQISGTPHQVPMLHLRITLPSESTANETITLNLSAKFGFAGNLQVSDLNVQDPSAKEDAI